MAQSKKYILNYLKAGMHVPAKFESWHNNQPVTVRRGTLLEELEIINPYKSDYNSTIIRCTSIDHVDVIVDCSNQDLSELSTYVVKLLLPVIDFDLRLQMFRDPDWIRELCQIDVNTPVEVEFHGVTYPGIVRYCGEVRGMDPPNNAANTGRGIGGGIYFGVELVDHRGHGDCDGFKLGKQYFTSDDHSGCFVNASQIRLRHVPLPRSHHVPKLTADNAVVMTGAPPSFSSSAYTVAPSPPQQAKHHHHRVARMTALLPSLHLKSSKHDKLDENGKNHSSITSSIVHAFGGGKSKQRNANGASSTSGYSSRDYEFDSGAATASDEYRGRVSSTSSPGAGYVEEPSSLYNGDILDSNINPSYYRGNGTHVRPAAYAGDVSPQQQHRQIDTAVDNGGGGGISKWSPRILGRRHERAATADGRIQPPIQAYAAPAAVAARVGESTPVRLNDRIVWIDEEGRNQYGTVKWIGHMLHVDPDWMVGVEFDNPVGSGTGFFEREQLFKARQNHASFVPVAGLMLADDFEESSLRSHHQQEKPQAGGRGNTVPTSNNSVIISTVTSSSRNNNGGVKPSTSNPEHMNGTANLPPRRLYGKAEDYLPSHYPAPKAEPEFFEPLPRLEQLTMTTTKQSSRAGSTQRNDLSTTTNIPVNRCDSMTEVAEIFFTNEDDHNHSDNNMRAQPTADDNYSAVSSSTHYPATTSTIIRRETGDPNGRWKGIQGTRNSCYLDTTLFSMFYFTSVFDNLLYRPPRSGDIEDYETVQRTLRDEVVRPLREHRFVPHANVMQLRRLLDSLGQVQGLTSDEKDPEEFIESLLSQTLKADPLLHLSSGETSTMLQLIVDPTRRDERELVPTVQELFDESTKSLNVQFTRVPSCLILLLPRSGSNYKMYRFTIPNLWLDITEALKCAPPTTTRVRLQLFAVICIRTSHYVAFVRSRGNHKLDGGQNTAKDGGNWYFFDSMADREEFPTFTANNAEDDGVVDNGCCVPEVKRVWPNNLDTWIGTDDGIRKVRQFLVDNGLVQPPPPSSSHHHQQSSSNSSDAVDEETGGRRTPSNTQQHYDDDANNDNSDSNSNRGNPLPADIPNALLSRFLQDAYVCMYEQRVEPSSDDTRG